jgi:predicted CoA-binding protein
MPIQYTSLETIEDFLAQKRIAMVGISRETPSISVSLFKELCRRGYEVVPVNPNVKEVIGRKCFACVQDIEPPVDSALLMTSPGVTEAVVNDCIEFGIKRIWMYRAGGQGAVSENAVEICREKGINVICSFPKLGASIGSTVACANSLAAIQGSLTLRETAPFLLVGIYVADFRKMKCPRGLATFLQLSASLSPEFHTRA